MEKKSKLSRFYFWLFIMLAIMAAFLFWSARNAASTKEGQGINLNLIAAIIATALAMLVGLICFVRFIRTRSLAGGLFLTTSISTAIFLGSSQVVAAVVPPTASALASNPEATNTGITTVIGLAQIGLFALWFLFLLLTIYLQVRPVKRIDKTLQRLIDGDELRRVRIGKAKQYRGIEEKISAIAARGIKRETEAARRARVKQCAIKCSERN